MSYDKAKTFDRADKEMDKMIQEEERTDAQRSDDKFWGEHFKDPVEKLLVVVKDKKDPNNKIMFRLTTRDENKVLLSVGQLRRELKKYNYGIADIETMIHNHFKDRRFSDRDKSQYEILKKEGFGGKYMMYSAITGYANEYKPDEKKKENNDVY